MITDLSQVSETRLTWPDSKPRAARRERGPFRPHEVMSEQRELEFELERWGIRQFIVSRNNQRIFAGDPGVAVWWLDRKKHIRVLACDRWETLAANMHALCLTFNAMRALERWGAYTAEQAAEGARLALPAPDGEGAPNWRGAFQMASSAHQSLPRAEQLAIANAKYRELSRAVAGHEADMRRLNLAIEAARKELGAP